MAWFNKKIFLINEVDDKILMTTFTNGLYPEELLFSMYKNNTETMVGVNTLW